MRAVFGCRWKLRVGFCIFPVLTGITDDLFTHRVAVLEVIGSVVVVMVVVGTKDIEICSRFHSMQSMSGLSANFGYLFHALIFSTIWEPILRGGYLNVSIGSTCYCLPKWKSHGNKFDAINHIDEAPAGGPLMHDERHCWLGRTCWSKHLQETWAMDRSGVILHGSLPFMHRLKRGSPWVEAG